MSTRNPAYTVSLLYSYSHRDSRHREDMETALSLLRRNGQLVDWSDQSILPGRSISASVRDKMDEAHILIFLLSQDFLASEECMKEWERAKELAQSNPLLFRIPIIVRECPWKDLLKDDDIRALPDDGIPVASFPSPDAAWNQVYEGIKIVVEELRNTFEPKLPFLKEMSRTDFIAQQKIDLRDIFVFLPLLCRGSQNSSPDRPIERITTVEDLLLKEYALIHGEDRSGKSALGRFIFVTLTEESKPVLYLDLNKVPQTPGRDFLRQTYESQFHGDYALWIQQSDKTLIMDNLNGRSDLIEFVVASKDIFERVIVTLPSNVFNSFFRDESRLADFEELEIANLTHVQQETLIRKRLSLTTDQTNVSDSEVDKIENRINSIILDEKIVPRYPFFVLCILQTYEAYMPAGMTISSYGHCYHALIVASLVRAGVSAKDSDINACLNFAEHLALAIYNHRNGGDDPAFKFDEFVEHYRENFIISQATISRLKHDEFGLINGDGQFRTPYMHYFFLGKFLSRGDQDNRKLIQRMCDATHTSENFLTLLFTIHHTNDLNIIDDILLRTMTSLEDVQPATLHRAETLRFQDIVSGLSKNILSGEGVEAERKREREARDNYEPLSEESDEVDTEETDVQEAVNGIFRVLKNNEIMGQILRNKYGSISREKIEEIIEIMADGGLRLINLILKDEQEITQMAHVIKAKNEDYDIQRIRRDLSFFSFLWTMINVEHIVRSINVPEIRTAILQVVERTATPAHDIIGYFTMLDTSQELEENERAELARLLKKHEDPFVRGVLSIRTQHYMNTHRSKARVEQSVSSLLGIRYRPRPALGGR